MHYYEIEFYGQLHDKDWTFYLKSEKKLTDQEIKSNLESQFLGVDGLEQHHIDNIVSINEIAGQEFTECCGISA